MAMPLTTMLYNDPHPVHRVVGEELEMSFVEAEKGGPHHRLLSAINGRYDGDVVLEGGVPLLEAWFLNLLRRVGGKTVLLAGDETAHNLVEPLHYYGPADRLAHRAGFRAVDGVIAISELVAEQCRQVTDAPVSVAHPFVLEQRRERLLEVEADLDGDSLLCVGVARPGNNQTALIEAASGLDSWLNVDLVGRGTDELSESPAVSGHGYVTDDELIEFFAGASLFVWPAIAGGFGLAPVEAMCAGVPALVSNRTGAAAVAADVDERLVIEPTAESVADRIRWYIDLSVDERTELGNRCREVGRKYSREERLPEWRKAFDRVGIDC